MYESYLITEVIWEAETSFFAHALETATAPVDSVLGQEKHHWQDHEGQKTKDQECSQGNKSKKLVDLMLDIGDDFQATELALLLHRSIIAKAKFVSLSS